MNPIPPLPTEIIILILSNLATGSEATTTHLEHQFARPVPTLLPLVGSTLLTCGLVSRLFYSIVRPWMYRKVSISSPWLDNFPDGVHRRLRQFTRTIASDPDLATLVKELSVDHLGEPKSRYELPEREEGDDARDEIWPQERYMTMRRFNYAVRDDYQSIIDDTACAGLAIPTRFFLTGNDTAMLVTLLHHLPALESLTLQCGNEVENIAYAALGGYRSVIPAGLRSLNRCTLLYAYGLGGFQSAAVVPFLSLPSLRSLDVGPFAGDVDDSDWLHVGERSGVAVEQRFDANDGSLILPRTPDGGFDLLPGTSTVTQLDVRDSDTPMASLSRILTVPIGLRSFSYGQGGANVGDTRFFPCDVLPGLRAQAETLEELVFDGQLRTVTSDRDPVLRSLSFLTALKHLTLPAGFFINPFDASQMSPLETLLPPSLVTLVLRMANTRKEFERVLHRTGLPGSLERVSRVVPALREVTIVRIGRVGGLGGMIREILTQVPSLHPPIDFSILVED